MKRLNILKVIDQWGWAYDFLDREQKKYSHHNIIIKKLFDLNISKLNSSIDIVYFHSPNIEYDTEMRLINKINRENIKIIGGYGGETNLRYNYADLIISISYPFIDKLKEIYSNQPVIFLPESVDTKFWNINKKFNKDKFIPGYAGKIHNPLKRAYLLDRLNYRVLKQAEWGKNFFIENRSSLPMLYFYNNIDVLLVTSRTECMPRVILEAMSCGIPIISTDVGCIRMLLDPEWIVPNSSDNIIITETNKKLELLKNSISLREEVGKRNKQHIKKYFSWKKNSILWDKVFESLYFNDYETIKKLSNNFLTQFNYE